MRIAFNIPAVCTMIIQENFSAHLLFNVHHIDPVQTNSNIDSFALSPLEDPLPWFVNLTQEESAPFWCRLKCKHDVICVMSLV